MHLHDINFNLVITLQKNYRNSDLCFFWYIPFLKRDNCGISHDLTKPHIKKFRTYFTTTAINLLNNTQILHHISQYFKEYPSPFVIIIYTIPGSLTFLFCSYKLTHYIDKHFYTFLFLFFSFFYSFLFSLLSLFSHYNKNYKKISKIINW